MYEQEETGRNPSINSEFYENWISRKNEYLNQLIEAESQPEDTENRRKLIESVFRHYQAYYEEKSRMARINVFCLLSPPWLSSYEKALLWIAGWKPSLAFRIINSSVQLTSEQKERIDLIRKETQERECELSQEMSRLQASMEEYLLIMALRSSETVRNGERDETEEAIEGLKHWLQMLVQSADSLRIRTVRNLVEILFCQQKVKFLIAALQLQLRLQRRGLQLDAANGRH